MSGAGAPDFGNAKPWLGTTWRVPGGYICTDYSSMHQYGWAVFVPDNAAHDARVRELLAANNAEVERRRAAERRSEALGVALAFYAYPEHWKAHYPPGTSDFAMIRDPITPDAIRDRGDKARAALAGEPPQ